MLESNKKWTNLKLKQTQRLKQWVPHTKVIIGEITLVKVQFTQLNMVHIGIHVLVDLIHMVPTIMLIILDIIMVILDMDIMAIWAMATVI